MISLSECLTNILYVAVSIIAMFIEPDVDLEILTLVKVTSHDFNCLIELFFWLKKSDFWLNWDVTKVKDLFSIWVEVKLLSCLTWTMIHCSFSFKVMSCWSFSSINILMISFNWSWVHWWSCWLMLMSHEIVTFWDSVETSKEIMKTRLLAILLSRWAVYDSTDSKSRIIVRKIDR